MRKEDLSRNNFDGGMPTPYFTDFKNGDIIELNGYYYFVIENEGSLGTVLLFGQNYCLTNFTWNWNGQLARFVRKPTEAEIEKLGLLKEKPKQAQLKQIKIFNVSEYQLLFQLEDAVNNYVIDVFIKEGNYPEIQTNSKFVTVICNCLVDVS